MRPFGPAEAQLARERSWSGGLPLVLPTPADADTPDSPFLAIFDHDGVLVDSLAYHQDAWVELGRRAELPITPEFIRETFGMTNPSIFRRLLGDAINDDQIRQYSDLKEDCYRHA